MLFGQGHLCFLLAALIASCSGYAATSGSPLKDFSEGKHKLCYLKSQDCYYSFMYFFKEKHVMCLPSLVVVTKV